MCKEMGVFCEDKTCGCHALPATPFWEHDDTLEELILIQKHQKLVLERYPHLRQKEDETPA